ncbi:alpha-N-acetyl-neuraminyl-2,3-beta-galactosyl-1,3-N-acetyl-galactosaminide alpha-2,6-sialyltransferase-like [Glandiceps talaboti]
MWHVRKKKFLAIVLIQCIAVICIYIMLKRANSAIRSAFDGDNEQDDIYMKEIYLKQKQVNEQINAAHNDGILFNNHGKPEIPLNLDLPLSDKDHRTYYISPDGKLGLNFHCKTCAYLPSSGRLLGLGVGEEIDNNDCVIRMNVAPVTGFEKDYGTKTTVRVICFMSTPGMRDHIMTGDYSPKNIIFWGVHPLKQAGAYKHALEAMEEYTDINYYFFRPETEEMVNEMFEKETGTDRRSTNSWLSTGLFAMLMATDVCDHINVYGMVDENYCHDNPNDTGVFHYYGPWANRSECGYYYRKETTKKGAHRFLTEKAVLGRWAHRVNATFLYPSWDGYDFNKTIETPFVSDNT